MFWLKFKPNQKKNIFAQKFKNRMRQKPAAAAAAHVRFSNVNLFRQQKLT
jgi:hypothetical protein